MLLMFLLRYYRLKYTLISPVWDAVCRTHTGSPPVWLRLLILDGLTFQGAEILILCMSLKLCISRALEGFWFWFSQKGSASGIQIPQFIV